MTISAKNSKTFPVLCGLLADRPTRLSQAMHSAGFAASGLPFSYVAFDTVDTAGAIQAMRTLGIRGFSLTIPHKEAALALVDRLADEVKKIGAANTVINEDGILTASNTDWIGIRDALFEAGFNPSGKKALIIGAGGAARAAAYALGTLNSASVSIANRSNERAEKLAAEFGETFLPYQSLNPRSIADFDLVINSTPVGSKLVPQEKLPVDYSSFHAGQCVFDFVTAGTELLTAAEKGGAKTIAGARMLLFQALEQFRLFTGESAPREKMEQALKNELQRQQ